MAHGALPATLSPHLGQSIRTTRSFWRTPRGIILILFSITLIFYLVDPLNTHTAIRRQQPRQASPEDIRQKVLEKLNSNGGDPLAVDPLAPGSDYAPASVHRLGKVGTKYEDGPSKPAAKEEEHKGPLPESKLYPDEWEAIEQAQDSIRKQEEDNKHKKEEAARQKENEEQEDLRKVKEKADEERRKKFAASAEKHGGEAARKQAEAANPRKDRDKRPDKPKEQVTASKELTSKSKDGSKDADTTPKNRLSVKLDADNSGAHDHPDAPPPSYHNNLTSTLVMGRLADDFLKVVWIHAEIRSLTNKRVYIVDDPTAEYHLKRNKGREAMVYLRYILDFYDNLDDVTLFYHSSREAWHNSVLFNRDAAIMINNLNRSHVMDVGYMNARCELYPGCTGTDKGWIKFNPTREQHLKHWERNADLFNTKLWDRLFPDRDHDPVSLGEPCCSQFAVSREMLRSVPKATYQRIHDWLGTTEEIDGYTGRIMEYVWQHLFLKKDVHCNNMRDCYCKGYGLCLDDEGAALLQEYNHIRGEIDNVLMKLEREDKENGCDDINLETEKARHEQCIKRNIFLKPLNETRTRKTALEKLLPSKYGILRPNGKVGDGLGNVTGDIG